MQRLIKSFGYAVKGWRASLREQLNLKIMMVAGILVATLGFYFRISSIEWCIVLLAIGLVISLEIANTAIENLVDLVMPEYHEKAGRVKDLMAGAVLFASVIAAIVGLIIFVPYFI